MGTFNCIEFTASMRKIHEENNETLLEDVEKVKIMVEKILALSI